MSKPKRIIRVLLLPITVPLFGLTTILIGLIAFVVWLNSDDDDTYIQVFKEVMER